MGKQPRILVIEDNELQCQKLKAMLEKNGYDVFFAHSGSTGMKMVIKAKPDVILLDIILPDISGQEVCRWIKEREDTKAIPVIMLTVKRGLKDKVAGLNIGADDYLPKPFKEMELIARIYASLRMGEHLEELKRKNTQLEDLLRAVEVMAVTDHTTRLYNRRHFEDVLQKEHARATRYEEPVSVMMIDIDHFKSVNDEFGHRVGDLVLLEMGEVISNHFRRIDTVARYGGEEFSVLLPRAKAMAAHVPAERLLKDVARHAFKGLKGHDRKLTVSIGIAGLPDSRISNEEQLLHAADEALYQAKRGGRNRIEVYKEENPETSGV
jgi:two-component system, cell cycle response regulator